MLKSMDSQSSEETESIPWLSRYHALNHLILFSHSVMGLECTGTESSFPPLTPAIYYPSLLFAIRTPCLRLQYHAKSRIADLEQSMHVGFISLNVHTYIFSLCSEPRVCIQDIQNTHSTDCVTYPYISIDPVVELIVILVALLLVRLGTGVEGGKSS